MNMCTKQYCGAITGTVRAVHTVVGVATDDYEALVNKPKINGVELSGNVTPAKLGFLIGASSEGDTIVISIVTGG